ncbi:MAG: hypothetical protein AAF725_14560, partial [Acidobacteriota bacterium]
MASSWVSSPAGSVRLGPQDSFSSLAGYAPALEVNADANRVSFDYGTLDLIDSSEAEIDLLLTLTVSSEPFADRLRLTNHVQASQSSTGLEVETREAIVAFTLRQPVIRLTKGAVGTDNSSGVFDPAAAAPVAFAPPPNTGEPFTPPLTSDLLGDSPIDSDLGSLDAGDLVTFAVVLENLGGSGAYDMVVRDALPAGLEIPSGGFQLTVRRGDGAALTPIFLGPSGRVSDFFQNGVEIVDPGGQPACQKFEPDSGRNVVVLTYELRVADATALPGALLANGASLESFTGADGSASDHLAGSGPLGDSSLVRLAEPGVVKELVSTSEAHTPEAGGTWPAAVGEELHYRATVTVPEGVDEPVRLVDTLDAGMVLVSLDSLVASAGLSTSQPGGFAGVLANASISADGREISLDFATLTNADRDNESAETVVLDYTVRLDDQPSIVQGVRRNNRLDWIGSGASVRDRAAAVRVVEPTLTLTKSVSPASADAGDTVTFTLAVEHAPGSETGAFDLVLEDLLSDADLQLVGGSVVADGGTIASGSGGSDETVRVELDSLALGETLTVTFDAAVRAEVVTGSVLENTAALAWDSLPADAPPAERSYGPLLASATIAVDVPSLAKTVASTSEASTGSAMGESELADLTLGERVVFEIVATLPEGITTQVVIRDSLPAVAAGVLQAVGAEVVSVGARLSAVRPSPTPLLEDLNLGDGLADTVTFDFGQVTNAPDMALDAGDRI